VLLFPSLYRNTTASAKSFAEILQFRFNPARAHEAPAAKRFKNGEQARRHKNQAKPPHIIHDDDARDEAQRADDAAREASVAVKVGFEKPAHA